MYWVDWPQLGYKSKLDTPVYLSEKIEITLAAGLSLGVSADVVGCNNAVTSKSAV